MAPLRPGLTGSPFCWTSSRLIDARQTEVREASGKQANLHNGKCRFWAAIVTKHVNRPLFKKETV
jgi:hypothetical protein